MRKLMFVLSSLASLGYLVFRALYTLNCETALSTAFSATVLAAECHGVTLMLIYFFQIWNITPREQAPDFPDKSVDVFLPTLNEDCDILRGSIQSYKRFDYPCNIYVLDDGNRQEVRELAEEMGVKYIARSSSLHAKAGNLNNAIDQTDGEFIVIFDADHIARPNFISRTIGYFSDPEMAFVQTPHEFYNFDSFASSYCKDGEDYWEEGDTFYRCVQRGKSNANAVIFCGSAAILRRSALESVGLIATETITEDMHTGLRLHAKGWKSAFVHEPLIAAQAAPEISAYFNQRSRWGAGNLSIIKHDNPLTMPGLSLKQRIHYFGSLLGWTGGASRLVLYLSPIFMLLSDLSPVITSKWSLFLGLLVLHFTLAWTAMRIGSNGTFRYFRNELTGMLNFWVQIRSIRRAFKSRSKFVVTKKRGAQSDKAILTVMPQMTLFVAGVVAIVFAFLQFFSAYNIDPLRLIVGASLIVWHSYLILRVVYDALKFKDRRYSYRHEKADYPALLMPLSEEGEVMGRGIPVVIENINERGAKLRANATPELNSCRLKIYFDSHVLEASGDVAWSCANEENPRKLHELGFAFKENPTRVVNDLWDFSIRGVVEKRLKKFRGPNNTRGGQVFPGCLNIVGQSEVFPILIDGSQTATDGASVTFRAPCYSPTGVSESLEVCMPSETIVCDIANPNEIGPDNFKATVTKHNGESRGRLVEISEHQLYAKTLRKAEASTARQHNRSKVYRFAAKPFLLAISVALIFFAARYSDYLYLDYLGHKAKLANSEAIHLLDAATTDSWASDPVIAGKLLNALDAHGISKPAKILARRAATQWPRDSAFLQYAIQMEESPAEAMSHLISQTESYPELLESRLVLFSLLRLGEECGQLSEGKFALDRLIDFDLDVKERLECAGHAAKLHDWQLASAFLEEDVPDKYQWERLALAIDVAFGSEDLGHALALCRQMEFVDDLTKEQHEFLGKRFYWLNQYEEAYDQLCLIKLGEAAMPIKEIYADCSLQLGSVTDAVKTLTAIESKGGDMSLLAATVLLECLNTLPQPLSSDSKHLADRAKRTEMLFSVEQADTRFLWAAITFLESSDPDVSLRFLQKNVDVIKTSPDLGLHFAQCLFAAGLYTDALEQCDAFLPSVKTSPAFLTTTQLKARCLAELEKYKDAAAILETAYLENTEVVATDLIELASYWLRAGQAKKCLTVLEDMPDGTSTPETKRLELGAYSMNNDWEKLASEAAQLPSEMIMKDAQLVELSFQGMLRTDQLKAAETFIHRAKGIDSALLSRLERQLGEALIWSDRPDEGVDLLLDNYTTLAACSDAEINTAECALLTAALSPSRQAQPGPLLEACRAVVNAVDNSDADEVKALLCVEYCLKYQSPQRAFEILESLAASTQEEPGVLFMRARALEAVGKTRSAATIYNTLLESNAPTEIVGLIRHYPTKVIVQEKTLSRNDLLLHAARCAVANDELNTAIDHFASLDSLIELSDSLLLEYGGLLAKQGFHEKSLQELARVKSPTFNSVLLKLDIQIGMSDWSTASRTCQKAVGLATGTKELAMAWSRQAVVSEALGIVHKAGEIYERVYRVNEDATYRLKAARAFAAAQDWSRSLMCYEDVYGNLSLNASDYTWILVCVNNATNVSDWWQKVALSICRSETVVAYAPQPLREQIAYTLHKYGTKRETSAFVDAALKDSGSDSEAFLIFASNLLAEQGDIQRSNEILRQLERRLIRTEGVRLRSSAIFRGDR